MTVLNKGELVDIIAAEKEINKKEATAWLEDVFKTLETVVTEYGSGFKLGDIGTFDVVDVAEKEREFTHLQTKEKFTKVTPAHFALKFKVNKRTKEALIALKTAE
jgi:nucleoid DNA-binding protein